MKGGRCTHRAERSVHSAAGAKHKYRTMKPCATKRVLKAVSAKGYYSG